MAAAESLAVLLASIGNTLDTVGEQIGEKGERVQKFQLQKELDILNRPAEEEELRRRLFIRKGIDPGTGEFFPGYLDALRKQKEATRLRGRGGGGRRRRRGGTSGGDLF